MHDFIGAELGFVKIWRCLLESKLAGLSLSHQGLALNLLLRANHSTCYFHKQEIKPGETIISQHRFAERVGISRTTLSAKLNDLKAVGFINFRTNKNYTFITIKNWSKYQNVEENKQKNGHPKSKELQNDINNIEDQEIQKRFSSDAHLYNNCTSYLPEDVNTPSSNRLDSYTIKECKNDNNLNNKKNENNNFYSSKTKKENTPQGPIFFNYEKGYFENISNIQRIKWDETYKNINVNKELNKAKNWLLNLEHKATKGDKFFLENWLERANKSPVKDVFEELLEEYEQTGKV